MGEQYYMACVLSLAALAAVIFLAWTNGLNRFNPTWMVAASTMVIMVWVVYGAMWLLRLCVSLEKLLCTLHATLQYLEHSQETGEELVGQ